jgi:diacylglycerol kinase (ATP)
VEKVEFDIALSKNTLPKLIAVYFFDLVTKRPRAFAKLREASEKEGKVVAIVCGGDGTIMWVVSEMYKYGINPARVAIGVIPLGTGNDFSQHLGWGKEKTTIIENKYRHLKKLMRRWLLAKE